MAGDCFVSDVRICPRCEGTGCVPLAPWLQETADLIRLSAKTPGYIADKLKISQQAANNRLKKLVDYGLLTRRGVPLSEGGRTFLYRRSLDRLVCAEPTADSGIMYQGPQVTLPSQEVSGRLPSTEQLMNNSAGSVAE
jgi:hypothetical protein